MGLGDLGVQGMGVAVSKTMLYTALGGVDPADILAVCLDVGTNNEQLLNDPLYIGTKRRRLRGDAYDELLDEFVEAAKRRVRPSRSSCSLRISPTPTASVCWSATPRRRRCSTTTSTASRRRRSRGSSRRQKNEAGRARAHVPHRRRRPTEHASIGEILAEPVARETRTTVAERAPPHLDGRQRGTRHEATR